MHEFRREIVKLAEAQRADADGRMQAYWHTSSSAIKSTRRGCVRFAVAADGSCIIQVKLRGSEGHRIPGPFLHMTDVFEKLTVFETPHARPAAFRFGNPAR